MNGQDIIGQTVWLNLSFLRGTALVMSLLLNACTGLPPLMMAGDRTADAPNGPQVAALVAHLKCEIWDAANSTQVLPFYDDSPKLTTTRQLIKNPNDPEYRRAFTLQNLFKEIEYIGEATWTLDVTQTGAVTPTTSAARYFNGTRGLFPATGSTLSVGGQLSEGAHRYVTFNSSVDFERLNETEPAPFEAIAPPVTPLRDDNQRSLCSMSNGVELGGDLGVKETLATALIAAAMSDISALEPLEAPSPGTTPGGIALGPIPVPSSYSFGQISTQVDFTIIEGVSGGALWSLIYFKGPGLSLLNFSRQVKDQLILTFVPVCIRQKYWTDSVGPPYKYSPRLIEGTPPWAKLLPPCGGVGYEQARINATATAQSRNDLILLQSSMRGL
jgi:hypothetical protein